MLLVHSPKDWYPNYTIIEIGQNTEKSPGDLKWLIVIQTPADLKNSLGEKKKKRKKKIIIIIIIIIINLTMPTNGICTTQHLS